MEFRHLKYFQILAEELHFGKAAERLFIAQPPLSRQIKQLEIELGVPLFKRNKRNVALTEQGHYLLKQTRVILELVNKTKADLKLINQGHSGHINIGYVGATMHSILPELLLKLKQHFPNINTTLLELSNEDQISGIKSGRIHVGFVRTPIQIDGITSQAVLREKFTLVLPKRFKIKKGIDHPLKALKNEPFIAFARDCGPALVDSALSICKKAGYTPNVTHESTQINAMLRLVEVELGYTIVPKSVKKGYELKLQFIDLDEFEEWAELNMIYNAEAMHPIINNLLRLFPVRADN